MPLATCNELADYQWLTGDEAAAFAAELAADPAPLHTTVARLRAHLSPARTHLVVELVELRRRAAAKFTQADRMFFTRIALEQATDQWIAAHKAARFPPTLIADLCCGLGGDLLALAERAGSSPTPTLLGVDLNPIAAHLAAANARAVLNRDIIVHVVDVADFNFDGVTAWHLDPDRRPGTRHGTQVGRRTTSLDFCAPDRAAIDRLLARVPHAAIKLAPATDVPAEWAIACEREWISRDRECRQQIAWHGNLAQAPGQHRATLLPAACGLAPRTITGQPNQRIPITHQPARYLFDVDHAVLAAHLTGTLAAEHNLQALSAGPTYLTGDKPIIDAALACFEVTDVMPLRTRTLVQLLRSRNIGQLEIKKRGVDTDVEKLRRDLKLRGENTATLLITPIAGRPTAIVAKRIQ
jgi:THUMP domain-like